MVVTDGHAGSRLVGLYVRFDLDMLWLESVNCDAVSGQPVQMVQLGYVVVGV